MRRRVNGEAISETDWGSFQSLKVEKTRQAQRLRWGMSTKGEKDQSGRNLWRDIFSELKRTFADSAWMRSLVSFLRFVEEVRKIPWLHSIL